MSLGSVLYIEDSESQRKSLKMALEHRGFSVEVAGDVASARSLFEKLRGQIDVVVLDMLLEDPKWPQMTGADVAMEYFSPQTPYPPEFLIHSAYSEVDYYKLALKLGVASYLEKSEYRQVDLIRHLRALMIRRLLSIKRPVASDRIQRIVEASRNRSEAIVTLCRDELEPTFSGRLGMPFVFLITEGDDTCCYTREAGLPERLDLYKTIQAMVRPGNPFIADASKMPEPSDPEEKEVLLRLNAAAFIPLTIDEDIRLSIGLLTADKDKFPLADPPAEMAPVVARYLTSDVIKPFGAVLKKWAEHDIKRKELVKMVGELYVSFGRSQLSILQRLERSFPRLAENADFRQLQNMVEDLQATGSILESHTIVDDRRGYDLLPVTRVSLHQIVNSVWANLDNGISPDVLSIHGDCDIAAMLGDLSLMVSCVLEWFAQRLTYTPSGIEPRIAVRCHRNEKGTELIFEDRSARLDKMLREHLFTSFAGTTLAIVDHDDLQDDARPYSSLFLTRLLIKARYNGVLEDISDVNDGSDGYGGDHHGHRFRMYFPDLHSGAYK